MCDCQISAFLDCVMAEIDSAIAHGVGSDRCGDLGVFKGHYGILWETFLAHFVSFRVPLSTFGASCAPGAETTPINRHDLHLKAPIWGSPGDHFASFLRFVSVKVEASMRNDFLDASGSVNDANGNGLMSRKHSIYFVFLKVSLFHQVTVFLQIWSAKGLSFQVVWGRLLARWSDFLRLEN